MTNFYTLPVTVVGNCDLSLQRVVGRCLQADGTGFGHAEDDGEIAQMHVGQAALHHLDGTGSAAGPAGSQSAGPENAGWFNITRNIVGTPPMAVQASASIASSAD
jgi:hypothetical protein